MTRPTPEGHTCDSLKGEPGGSKGRPAWQVLVAIAGVATAVVVVLYLIGGAIVWLRLHTLGLPANPGVAALPRELLVVVGVRALAWPLVLGLLAFVVVHSVSRLPIRWKDQSRALLLAVLALYLVLGAVALILVLAHSYVILQWLIFLAAFGLLVGVGVALADHEKTPVSVGQAGIGVLLAMVAVAAAVELLDIYRLPVGLESADVSFTTGRPDEQGFLVGVTPDTVYLAPNRDCHVLDRIVAVSRRDVERIEIYKSTDAWPQESKPDNCPTPHYMEHQGE